MSPTGAGSAARLRDLVAGIEPADLLERAHRADVLAWLGTTDDVYRRVPPATPPQHLAAYALLHDPRTEAVLLLDHRLSGLWLPAGGHVEVDEDPGETAAREASEELGLHDPRSGPGRPLLVTVTPTSGPPGSRHVDVTLWYGFVVDSTWRPTLDRREASDARWWSPSEIAGTDPARFDPHLGRCLAKLRGRGPTT